jgi:glycosyltransferase involved in cell wall biosynthesis
VERGTVDVARAIVEAGGRALVASRGGRLAPRLDRAGGRLIAMDVGAKSPLAILSNARRIAQIVREEGVDLIHARSRAPAWAGLRAAKLTGTPFVTTYHGVHSEGFPGKRLYNSVMARGRIVIAVSHHVAQVIAAQHPFARNVRVIHRGVDMAAFDPAAVSHQRIAQLIRRWGLDENPRPVIALPGRLTRWKGQEVFIEAARLLRDLRGAEDFLCLMIGDDIDSAYGRELAGKIEASGLSQVARLGGGCDDMAAALKLSAAGVSASTQPEAFGRVAAEVQAMERPVIATNHGGACETVADGQTGWLIPPGDAPALARAMQAALTLSPEAAEAMGTAGRARVAAEFSLGAMLSATLAVYRDAAGPGAG